jgi:hypothetical protein
MHDLVVPPTFVVGVEGMCVTTLACGIFPPATYFWHGTEGDGIHEGTLDTFEMLKSGSTIVVFVVTYVLVT